MSYVKSPYFETPPKCKIIWRYMSIDKFMSMISSKSLYFPNILSFEDRYEGALSDKSRKEIYQTNLLNEKNTPVKKDETFRKLQSFIEKAGEFHDAELLNYSYSFQTLLTNFSNHLMFCSSWFLRKTESYLMWSKYADNAYPASVAIQTTVGDLINSFENPHYDIHIGKVKYIDYEKEHIEGYKDFSSEDLTNPDKVLELFYAPIKHKREEYVDESEVRAIISFESICNDFLGRVYTSEIPFYSNPPLRVEDDHIYFFNEYDTNTIRKIPNVFRIETNLEKLLKKVVISPNAKTYFEKSLKELLEKYDMNPDIVEKSKI